MADSITREPAVRTRAVPVAAHVPDHELVVDRDRVAAWRERRAEEESKPMSWSDRLTVAGQVLFGSAVLTLQGWRGATVAETVGRVVVVAMGMSAIVGASVAFTMRARRERDRRESLEQEAARLQRRWDELHGPDSLRRAIVRSALFTSPVSLTIVGFLVAAGWPVKFALTGSVAGDLLIAVLGGGVLTRQLGIAGRSMERSQLRKVMIPPQP